MREYIIKFMTDKPISSLKAGETIQAVMKTVGDCDELVRCKDCKFLRFTGTVWKCQNRSVMMLCKPNDYCSRAERK